MKVNTFEYPKSALLGIEKDTSLIMKKIVSNQRVLKLIYYSDSDWRKAEDLTPEQIKSLFRNKQIWHVPRLQVHKDFQTYLRVSYGSFEPNGNPQYMDNIFNIDVICHFDYWDMGNFELRPYKIAGEIDSMLNGSRLTGIGKLQLIGTDPYVYNEEFGGVTCKYLAIRGHEDEVRPLTRYDGQESYDPPHGLGEFDWTSDQP